jgi:PIN like domain
LDENLCDCAAILTVLDEASFPFERHLAHFPRGTLDEDWLSLPGERGWAVLTKDKAQRYSPLEKAKILEHQLKIFAFSSGNLSGGDMAALLKANLRRLDRFARRHPAPFVASINRTGISNRAL